MRQTPAAKPSTQVLWPQREPIIGPPRCRAASNRPRLVVRLAPGRLSVCCIRQYQLNRVLASKR